MTNKTRTPRISENSNIGPEDYTQQKMQKKKLQLDLKTTKRSKRLTTDEQQIGGRKRWPGKRMAQSRNARQVQANRNCPVIKESCKRYGFQA